MIIPHLNPIDFTWRELETIAFIQKGFTTKEIAQSLHVSPFTIKKHRENIARKLGSRGKTEFRKTIFRFQPQQST